MERSLRIIWCFIQYIRVLSIQLCTFHFHSFWKKGNCFILLLILSLVFTYSPSSTLYRSPSAPNGERKQWQISVFLHLSAKEEKTIIHFFFLIFLFVCECLILSLFYPQPLLLLFPSFSHTVAYFPLSIGSAISRR